MYTQKLRGARVPVESKTYNGVTHEFFGTAAVLDTAKQAQQWASHRLIAAFQ